MAKRKKSLIELDELRKNELERVYLNDLNKIFLTDKQTQLLDVLKDNTVALITGPAGTAKTFMVCYYAIYQYAIGEIEHIILTKPLQEAGERMGFLPGDIQEKINPMFESFKSNFVKIIGTTKYQKLIKDDVIKQEPLAFMRGKTYSKSLIIGDEFQNSTWKQTMMFLTRMDKDSKVILNGDVSQYDIDKKIVSILAIKEMIKDIEGVGIFEFNKHDIMRHPILIEITDRYEKLKYSGNIREEK